MKRFFVIECDTEFYTVFVKEVTRDFSATTADYHHKADAHSDLYDVPSPKFYGQLDALLVTRGKIEKAAPIQFVQPTEKEALSVRTAN